MEAVRGCDGKHYQCRFETHHDSICDSTNETVTEEKPKGACAE
jgi:hypothetical protein